MINTIFLVILTLTECCFSWYAVMLGLFMVADDVTWSYVAPVAILVWNLWSIPKYIHELLGWCRYLYNICITVLVTVICYYGAIKWTNTISSEADSKAVSVVALIIIILSITGMITSVKISKRKRT